MFLRHRLLPLLAFFLFACSEKAAPPPEARGLKAVAAFYGGECDTARRPKGTLLLTLRHSTSVDSHYFPSNRHVASGAAYLFYNELGGAANRYDSIAVSVEPTGGQFEEAVFSRRELAEAASVMPFVQELAGRLRHKQYDALRDYFVYDPQLMTRPLDSLLADLRKYTEQERYDSFQPSGFRYLERPGGNPLLVVSGLLTVDGNRPTTFSVAVDPKRRPLKASFANFTLY